MAVDTEEDIKAKQVTYIMLGCSKCFNQTIIKIGHYIETEFTRMYIILVEKNAT